MYTIIGLFSLLVLSCKENVEKDYIWLSREVTATAYNSTVAQTDGLPTLAAWNDTLVPGERAIAVSRDLIDMGLKRNTQVKIEGLEGIYLVKDKMGRRWKNRIDIYMGNNVEKAREWGIKKLRIQFRKKKDSIQNNR